MDTNTLPQDVARKILDLAEKKQLTEMLCRAVDRERTNFRRTLRYLRTKAILSGSAAGKTRYMTAARNSYLDFRHKLMEILTQEGAINRE